MGMIIILIIIEILMLAMMRMIKSLMRDVLLQPLHHCTDQPNMVIIGIVAVIRVIILILSITDDKN